MNPVSGISDTITFVSSKACDRNGLPFTLCPPYHTVTLWSPVKDCMLGNFSCFLSSADYFQNQLFEKKSFRNTIWYFEP